MSKLESLLSEIFELIWGILFSIFYTIAQIKYVVFYVILLSIVVFSYNLKIQSFNFSSYIILAIITIFLTWIVSKPFDSSLIWLKRVVIYFFLWLISVIISSTLLSYLGTFDSNINSAQYLISALIQSEAAIIAIVITLTLVAVQQTASSYSARVIDVFKTRNPDFWILLLLYVFSMIYELGVLKAVREYNFDPTINPNHLANLEGHIFNVYSLGIFALIALIPYMWNTIDLLKPIKIMEFLSDNITNENMIKYTKSRLPSLYDTLGFKKKKVEDPFQPIVDIIKSSLVRYDYYTVQAGIDIMLEKIPLIYKGNSELNSYDFDSVIIRAVINHFEMIGHIAAKKTDGDILVYITESLFIIVSITISENKAYSTKRVLSSLVSIGKISAETKNEIALTTALTRLMDLKHQSTIDLNVELDIAINNLTFEAKKNGLKIELEKSDLPNYLTW